MAKWNTLDAKWQALLDVRFVPIAAHLPAAVPGERRDVAARDALACRIHSEFEEMPGLLLTVRQAARLFGLRPDIVSRILTRLMEARVLSQRRDGQFARRLEDA
jgi:DNA-binding transcriptional ArsR family regulator